MVLRVNYVTYFYCSTIIANMLYSVDHASPVSLAEQIAAQVRAGLINGELTPGERLPPARELAAALRVNMHTVLRAYHALRDNEIIEMQRGRGVRIRQDSDAARVRIASLVDSLLAEAHKAGVSTAEVLNLIERPNHERAS